MGGWSAVAAMPLCHLMTIDIDVGMQTRTKAGRDVRSAKQDCRKHHSCHTIGTCSLVKHSGDTKQTNETYKVNEIQFHIWLNA
jgi:hypothetical protein